MRFERGIDPKEGMSIGNHAEIKAGAYFHVRFRIRESSPAYYEYQRREKEGIPADAWAKDDEQMNFTGRRVVHCIVNGIPHETFTAGWSRKEKCWIIGPVRDNVTDDTGPQ